MIEIKELLTKFAHNIITDLKVNMTEYGLGSSNLANSIHAEVDETSVKIFANDYWDYAQKGSKPWSGAGDGSFYPRFENILLDWMKRYSIHSYDGDDRKFAIATKWMIIKHGSRKYRYPDEQRDFAKDAVEKNIESIKEGIKESLIKEIIEISKK